MRFTCPECSHSWEEEIQANKPIVMCPECYKVIPVETASAAASPAPSSKEEKPPAPLKQETVSRNIPDIHDQKTIVTPENRIPPFQGIPGKTAPEQPSETVIPTAPSTPQQKEKPEEPSKQEPTFHDMPTQPPSIPDEAPGLDQTKIITPEKKTPSEESVTADITTDIDEQKTVAPRQKEPPPSPESTEEESPGSFQKTVSHPAPTPTPTPKKIKFPEMQQIIGKNLGGYKVKDLLGEGGMGAVFRAHQVSLDRDVALKVLPDNFSRVPEFIARFTREALSAAQLNHHNIVQVYDVGNQEETHFISMEYVKGKSLGSMIREEGRLHVDDAAGYVLQAARGLKYAHDRGIIHRDIKPDNLMLNEHGVVKIMDMGLAKWQKGWEEKSTAPLEDRKELHEIARGDLTMADTAIGTPAYMSPEQCQDAASVDARADQYSLGCTLYYLCAGKAPYSGTTVFELLSKHMNEPLTPLEVHVKGIPGAFNAIILKMLEKKPEDRYPGMEEAIKDLESYLGVDTEKGVYTPREHHLAVLEKKQKEYYSAFALKKRKWVKLGFFTMMPLFILLMIIKANFSMAGGLLGLLILTPVMNFILNGIINKDYLFRRVRSVFFRMPLKSWAMTIGGVAGGLVALYFLGWIPFWIGFGVVAAAGATAYQILVLKPLRVQRAEPVNSVRKILREFRLKGVSEEAIMDFVCRFSGIRWEEFFEEFFGYENMLLLRGKWAAMEKVKPRKKHAVWREPISRWLENIEQARKEAREKRQLAKTEARRLKAKGISEKEAQIKAEQHASLVFKKGLIKKVEEKPVAKPRRKLALPLLKTIPWAFRIACGILGLAIVALGSIVFFYGRGTPAVQDYYGYVPEFFLTSGWGGSVFGIISGVMLFVSAFSRYSFIRIIVLIGAIMLVFGVSLVGTLQQEQFTQLVAYRGGLGISVGGIALAALIKLTGGRF